MTILLKFQKGENENIALSNVEPWTQAIEKYYVYNSWISLGFTNHYFIGISIFLYSWTPYIVKNFFEIWWMIYLIFPRNNRNFVKKYSFVYIYIFVLAKFHTQQNADYSCLQVRLKLILKGKCLINYPSIHHISFWKNMLENSLFFPKTNHKTLVS